MLRRLVLRDFVIVESLEVELDEGFSVLTGETGAGKSILIDALQLALGSRGDAALVREGAVRAEIVAEFDTPVHLRPWLDMAGFDVTDTVLLRRSLDTQGRSRAWINGGSATVAQLRDVADALVDIHGQHAWQSLMRPDAVRALLDAYAGLAPDALAATWGPWRDARKALAQAQERQGTLARERERLQWQIGEIDKLAPGVDEWAALNTEHGRWAHAQTILDATQSALRVLSDADDNADSLTGRAIAALQSVLDFDPSLGPIVESLQGAQAQLQDAVHSLNATMRHTDLDPRRLQSLDERLSSWVGLARRWRQPPEALPVLQAQWRHELQALEAASDLESLEQQVQAAKMAFDVAARQVSHARAVAAPRLSAAITQAMQTLGMAGGCFEVSLPALEQPQAFGCETVEFLVAGHEGSTPRPLAKVASGGELSRISLAIAVTTSQLGSAGTLIFDEIDTGVGGAVAEAVGQLMKQLGQDRQVMAVTHLPQVAACADHHFVVSKMAVAGVTLSDVQPVRGESRVDELARMLGGQQRSGASLAHAKEMLETLTSVPSSKVRGRKRSATS